jgi:metal-sulfur cluster biosynthetic enzyme
VAAVAGVGEVDVELVWKPPWSRDRMTDDARLALDLL